MNSKINTSMGSREWVMLLTLSLLWGGSFFFVEIAISELPPMTIVLLRVEIAAVTLWIFAIATGIKPPKNYDVCLAFFIMGLINNALPFSLIVWGQLYIASSLASILNATTTIFTVIIAGILLSDEKATPNKLAGVVIGFIGVVIMIGKGFLDGLGNDLVAQFAILGAAISYSFAGVYGRRFKVMKLSPIITAAGQVTASTIIMIPLVLYFEQPLNLNLPVAITVTSIICLAVLSTAVAYVLFFNILASAGATNLLLVTFLIPISAILLGTLILGESLQLIHLLGMLLIGIGLSAIDGRLWSSNTH